MTNFHEITSLIAKIAGSVHSNEKLALPIIAAKARREAAARPNDIPLVNASAVLTKMASTQTFISRSDLSEVVNRLSATHSKLASVFSDELGKQAEGKPAIFQREGEGSTLQSDYSKLADPLLSNALSAAMESDPREKLYTNEDAQRAQRAAQAQLLGVGIEPDSIETFAGRSGIIICQASHKTPKGIASVLIPVDIVGGKAVLPTLFLSRAGFQDLERESYIEHVKDVAGRGFKVEGSKLLDVLEQVKKGSEDPGDQVKFAAIKIASASGGTDLGDPNAILFQALDAPQKDVQLMTLQATEESTFAETLGKPDGVARFIHGDKVVEAGRSAVQRKFAELGYSNVQVRVSDVEQEKIFYAVAVGTVAGFKVPVEVQGQRVSAPKVLFADNFVSPLTKSALDQVVKGAGGGNRQALAAASRCYDMKPTELIDVVKESVAAGNFTRAEEAINVLGEIDPIAQKVAIAHMMMNIYEPGKSPGEEATEMRRLSNLEVRDTPQFMTSKIFFPEGA